MRFSLILPTVDRTSELERFLASLDAQSYRDFELIVVDQNPDDRLGSLLKPYAEEHTIIHLSEHKRGISRARNQGLKHISGDVVAFPDDDCVYPPDLLEKVAHTLASRPEFDGVTGCSIDVNGRISNGRFDLRPRFIDKSNVWGHGVSYAIFLRERCIRGVWFDEELGVGAGTPWGSGEETDHLIQLLERGASLYYDPTTVVVVHSPFVPPYDARSIRKAYEYGCGWGRVLQKRKMPWHSKLKSIVRPLGGTVLSLAGLRFSKARYHWNIFKGRLKGMRS